MRDQVDRAGAGSLLRRALSRHRDPARERVEYRGYQVDGITRQNNGSWKAEASRDALPTRPLGVPSRVIIYPDGRVVEEREPLGAKPGQ